MERENSWQHVTNIPKSGGSEEARIHEVRRAMGQEVRFGTARTPDGEVIPDMWSMEVREMIAAVGVNPEKEARIHSLCEGFNNDELITPYLDPDARYYRGTTLGFLLLALKEHGLLKSFDPDREGFDPMRTTVLSPRWESAEAYAKGHGPDTKTSTHNKTTLAKQLNLPETFIDENPALLGPIILHIHNIHATENPKWENEFHTNYPVSLFSHITPECKSRIERAIGMSLEDLAKIVKS